MEPPSSSPLVVAVAPLARCGTVPVVVATLSGEFSSQTADAAQEVVGASLPQLGAGSALALDVAGVRFMNSKAIGTLVTWHLALAERGARVVLVGPQAQVLDVLRSTGVTHLVAHGPTLEEALANTPELE